MDPTFTATLRPFLRFADGQPITEASSLRELGLDSGQAIELLFAIEDTFNVCIPDDLLRESTFGTAGSLWNAICRSRTYAAQDSA
jgi:acyl carrier protein